MPEKLKKRPKIFKGQNKGQADFLKFFEIFLAFYGPLEVKNLVLTCFQFLRPLRPKRPYKVQNIQFYKNTYQILQIWSHNAEITI